MPATDYDFVASRNEIVARAFRIIGALSTGEVLPADRLSQGVMVLNHIVKGWQADNIFAWHLERVDVTLVVGDVDYTLGSNPKVWVVDQAAIIDSTNIAQPIRQITWRDYNLIEDKESTGDPEVYAIDYQASPTLYTYPVTSRSGLTLALLAVIAAKDCDSSSAAPSGIPAQFQEALVYGLARDLADEYGLNMKERALYAQKAEYYYERLKRGGRERADMEFLKGAF